MEQAAYENALALSGIEERQEALERYQILGTPPEKQFDQITRSAAAAFGTPTALISLIDHEQQWLKSCFGFDKRGSSLDIPFCVHVMDQQDMVVVEDAAEDARFCDHPLVTEAGWRFYAGVPLFTPGHLAVGTLSIVDRKPRIFDADKRIILEDLASMVVGTFERRHREANFRDLFDDAPQPTLVYDATTHDVLAANEAAAAQYGYPKSTLKAMTLADLMDAEALHAHSAKRPQRAAADGSSGAALGEAAPFTTRHRRRDGTPLTVDVHENPTRFEGRSARIATMTDVAERHQQYQTLVENVQEVIFQTDLDGQATFLNASWEEITGRPAEDVLGTALLDHAHPHDRAESLEAFAPVLKREEPLCRHQVRFETEGGFVPMQLRARLLTDESNAPVGAIGTLTPLPADDVPGPLEGQESEEEQAPEAAPPPETARGTWGPLPSAAEEPALPDEAEALFEAGEEAAGEEAAGEEAAGEEAAGEEAAGEEAAGEEAAEDEAAEDEAAGDEAAGDEAAGDEAAGDEAAGGTAPRAVAAGPESLSEVRERLSASQPALQPTELDLVQYVHQILDRLEPAARREGLALHRALPKEAVCVETDPGALRLLLDTLVDSSIASTDEGIVSVRIRREEDGASLRVVDTGSEISKQFLNSLLQSTPAEQATSEEAASEEAASKAAAPASHDPAANAELNLQFIHRLVNLMQGSVEMDSKKGRGMVFSVTLPPVLDLDAAAEAQANAEPEAASPEAAEPEAAHADASSLPDSFFFDLSGEETHGDEIATSGGFTPEDVEWKVSSATPEGSEDTDDWEPAEAVPGNGDGVWAFDTTSEPDDDAEATAEDAAGPTWTHDSVFSRAPAHGDSASAASGDPPPLDDDDDDDNDNKKADSRDEEEGTSSSFSFFSL